MYNSQMVALRIKAAAKEKKIIVAKMLKDCEMNKDAISTMQSKGYLPRCEAICKIADYLDVSVDFLLGRTDNPEVNR